MASIDKIYATKFQREEFLTWCKKNKPEATKDFIPWDWDDELKHPITYFSTKMDMWMLKHCPFDFVVERIKVQYSIKEE